MKLNAYQLRAFNDNPLARVSELKINNPVVYQYLSINGFKDELLDQMLIVGKTGIENVLCKHLKSTSSLLLLKFKPDHIATIISGYLAEEKVKAINKYFEKLNKNFTVDEIAKIATYSNSVKTMDILCSYHYDTLIDNFFTHEQIYKLATRHLAFQKISIISKYIKSILDTNTITSEVLYNNIYQFMAVSDIEEYLRSVCLKAGIEYTSGDVELQTSNNNVSDINVEHQNKKYKMQLDTLDDEEQTIKDVCDSLIELGFTAPQLKTIRRYTDKNCLELIKSSFERHDIQFSPNKITQIALVEGGPETIKVLCSGTGGTLLQMMYTHFQITKLASRPFGSGYLSVLKEYTNQLIKLKKPKYTPEGLYHLALSFESAELFRDHVLQLIQNNVLRLQNISTQVRPQDSHEGAQGNDLVNNVPYNRADDHDAHNLVSDLNNSILEPNIMQSNLNSVPFIPQIPFPAPIVVNHAISTQCVFMSNANELYSNNKSKQPNIHAKLEGKGFITRDINNILHRGGEKILKYVYEYADLLISQFESISDIVNFVCMQNATKSILAFCSYKRQEAINLGYTKGQIIHLLGKISMSQVLDYLILYTPEIWKCNPHIQPDDIYNAIKDLSSIPRVERALQHLLQKSTAQPLTLQYSGHQTGQVEDIKRNDVHQHNMMSNPW